MDAKEFQLKLGARIKKLRIDKFLTQGGLAKRASVGVTAISRLERGLVDPPASTLAKIAQGLNVGLADLFSFDTRKEYSRRREAIDTLKNMLSQRSYSDVEDATDVIQILFDIAQRAQRRKSDGD